MGNNMYVLKPNKDLLSEIHESENTKAQEMDICMIKEHISF